MTPQPIEFDKIKPGDRIRYSLEGVVERVEPSEISLRSPNGRTRTITGTFGWDIELLERPLPPEPPEGSVVIFRHPDDDQVSRVQAYKRWGWGRWLHAGNSTPAGTGRSSGRGQGFTWQGLLEHMSDRAEMTVIEP